MLLLKDFLCGSIIGSFSVEEVVRIGMSFGNKHCLLVFKWHLCILYANFFSFRDNDSVRVADYVNCVVAINLCWQFLNLTPVWESV